MKLLLLLLLSTVAISLTPALAPGDDLASFWKANASRYTAARGQTPLPGWPGYETVVLATDSQFSKGPFVLVLRKIGGAVVQPFGTVEGPSSLVLDSDGDGLVDFQSSKSVVPGWLFLRVPGARGDGKAFRALADRIYRQYNVDRGPVPAQLSLLVDELRKSSTDSKDADRDLSGALLFSLEQGATQAAIGMGTLAALGLVLKTRGGPIPLVFLFLGEALEAGGLVEEAQASYDRILDLDPKSVIAAYKKARVDTAKLKAFRTAHPDFWASR